MYKQYCSDLASQSSNTSGKSNTQEKMAENKKPKTQKELWDFLNGGESSSLLKKHLKPELYEKLKDKKTKLGGTIADCIRSGRHQQPVIEILSSEKLCICRTSKRT